MSTVCVHGLGYIGLPTASMMANYGHKVYGYDVDPEVRSKLRNGEIHLKEPGLRAFVTQALESGQLEITDEVVEAKYHVVCVPTPFDEETKTPDLGYVEAAGEAVSDNVRRGDTVILESTVPPGTTNDVFRPVVEGSGLTAGTDFALVHCPETVLPGDIIAELRGNNRIIGGVNGLSTESAVRLYDSFVEGEIRTVSDPTIAEFVKLVQNTFRDVNIALANEIAKLADDYGIDSRETIELANRHPRVEIHQPGPGVGGHCLPIDPWFLGQGSEELDLIATGRKVNDGMSAYVIELLREELGALSSRRIGVLGVAYKGNVDDTRMSPGLKLASEIQHNTPEEPPKAADGGDHSPPEVTVHDPYVTDSELKILDLDNAIRDTDAVVVTTDHDEFEDFEPERFRDLMSGSVVIDTKAVLDPEPWREAGFSFRRL